MFRSVPISNKLCFQREHERKIHAHEESVRMMKRMIDNESPVQYAFLETRKKKEAIAEQRHQEIDHENKMLINKMTSIVNRGGSLSSGSRMHSTIHSSQSSSSFKAMNSLNNPQRKRESLKIAQENQALLQRIQTSKSEYSVRKWEDSRSQNELYISSISEFPFHDFKPNKTLVKLGVWHEVHLPKQLHKRNC